MAGRPRKHENLDLGPRVEHFRISSGMTYSQLANQVDVHCATLTRSVSTNLYSKDLEARLEQLLTGGRVVDDPVILLRKFVEQIPDLANALRSVLDMHKPAE